MDVSVQRGGPAFVLDGYQWYSNTAPLCSREGGGKKKKDKESLGETEDKETKE